MSTQRTIKFRVWHEGHGRKHPAAMHYEDRPGDALKWLAEGQPVHVMQFTGLCDKEGREIYEGDIPDGIWVDNVIKWCDHCHGWSLGVADIEGYCHQCEGDIMWLDFVADVVERKVSIAGNIYENPELIEA